MDEPANGRGRRRRGNGDTTELRRSSRTAAAHTNGHIKQEDEWGSWRGERRSSRLGAPPETQFDGPSPNKRARTVDSTTSEAPSTTSVEGNGRMTNGAAALKPTEMAMDQVAGKSK